VSRGPGRTACGILAALQAHERNALHDDVAGQHVQDHPGLTYRDLAVELYYAPAADEISEFSLRKILHRPTDAELERVRVACLRLKQSGRVTVKTEQHDVFPEPWAHVTGPEWERRIGQPPTAVEHTRGVAVVTLTGEGRDYDTTRWDFGRATTLAVEQAVAGNTSGDPPTPAQMKELARQLKIHKPTPAVLRAMLNAVGAADVEPPTTTRMSAAHNGSRG
jgi:hypothetical protein